MKQSGKISHLAVMLMTFVCWTLSSPAADLNWRDQFDQGLIQEEVHQDLEKAAEHYQSILTTYDAQRDVLAMSMYRLAETLRKLGRIDEAAPLYERIVREFPDRQSLVLLSQRFVPKSDQPKVNPFIIANDEALMNHPESLSFVMDQISEASPDEAMQMLVEFTNDMLARNLLSQYRIAQAELAQLRTRYKEKWPPLREQQIKVSTLEEQMKIHADKGVKLLEIRLTALMQKGGAGTGQTSEDMTQNPALNRSTRLVDQAETLRVLISELEKASTDVALQLLKKEAEIELPADLLHKKLDAEFELSKIKEKHPLYAELKAKRDFIYDQLYESVQTFIEQLRIKLRVLEGVNKPENQVTDTPSLLDKHETLKLFIEELEKAPTDLAIQMLIQETDDKVPTNLLNEKLTLTTELEGLLQVIGPDHPRIQEQKAKLDSIQKQMQDVVGQSIEQFQVRLRIMERSSSVINDNVGHPYAENVFLEELRVIAKEKPDLLFRSESGGSRPHGAAAKGYLKVLEFFLDQGVDINLPGSNGRTMLWQAVHGGNVNAVEFLLGRGGINVDKADDWNGETPLHKAAQLGHLAIAKLLIEAGADVNKQTKGLQPHSNEGHDVSHVMDHVIVKRRPDTPKAHLDDPRIPTLDSTIYTVSKVYAENLATKGNTPLHLAAQHGMLKMCSYLIQQGADVNARNACQLTPFFYSLLFYENQNSIHEELLDLLVANGADPNIPGIVNQIYFSNHSPKHNRRLQGAISQLLNSQREQIFLSYEARHVGIKPRRLTLLGNAQENIPELPVGWKSPLHIAVLTDDHLVEKLVRYGADINQQDDWGRTPVHDAFLVEDSNFVIRLFQKSENGTFSERQLNLIRRIDPMIKDYSGYRALDFAAIRDRHSETFEGLIGFVNADNKSQLSYEVFWNTVPWFNAHVRTTSPPELLSLLPELSSIWNRPGPEGLSPMELALRKNNLKFANWLLDQGSSCKLTPQIKRGLESLISWFHRTHSTNSEYTLSQKKELERLLSRFEEDVETK